MSIFHIVIIIFQLFQYFVRCSSKSEDSYLPYNISDSHRKLSMEYSKRPYSIVSMHTLHQLLKNNSDYRKRQPFPYMYADDLFPLDLLNLINEEIPDNPVIENGCVKGNTECSLSSTHEVRHNLFDNDAIMGPATAALLSFLKSSQFIKFIEKLTGISRIVPDPQYRGTGIHQTLSGGFQQIHADSNYYKQYKLHRRVNLFIYLNPDWKDDYGGHLELWHKDLHRCGAKLRPVMGRMVIFSATDYTYYGHPSPLQTSLTRSRRSLAVSYYTSMRPSSECIWWSCDTVNPTLWQTPACNSCDDKKCRSYTAVI